MVWPCHVGGGVCHPPAVGHPQPAGQHLSRAAAIRRCRPGMCTRWTDPRHEITTPDDKDRDPFSQSPAPARPLLTSQIFVSSRPNSNDKDEVTSQGRSVILLTLMLTTDLDEPGHGWNGSPIASGATRLSRRSWTTPDNLDLATDQKVVPVPCPNGWWVMSRGGHSRTARQPGVVHRCS
jgi:hypothetical protein